MGRFSVPILAWVIAGLLMVSALPFVTSWLQIDRSRDALVLETQQTQLVLARSIADELDRYYEGLAVLLKATADDPAVWTQPDSEAASDALGRVLLMHNDMLAAGSFMVTPEGTEPMFQVRQIGEELLPADFLGDSVETRPVLINADQREVVRMQRETPRPGQFLSVLVSSPQLENVLRIPGVTEFVSIVLLDAEGNRLAGDATVMDGINPERRQQIFSPDITVGSQSDYQADSPTIWAFAAVPETGWRVVTRQLASAAESASAEMRSAARRAFGATIIVVTLLSAGAWVFVVRPIRRLVRAHQRLAGQEASMGGGEIRQLEDSFGRLEVAIRERDKLSEVFLDRYQVISHLGAGAMGMVYLGRDPKLDRKVALKTILIGGDLGAKEREQLSSRLIQEGLTAAKLTHPNIVTVFDVLGDENHAFIAMEYVAGESLEEEIEREVALSPRRVAEIAEGVLKALVAAHREDVVHRDIKPGNILVTDDGTIKLSDFGIASYRRQVARGDEGLVLGTPGYLAPECYQSKAFDAGTDLFALGVTLVECLTGAPPFGGRNLQQIITRTSSRDVILPKAVLRAMPAPMADWINRLLLKDPSRRITSAIEALDELRAFQADLAASQQSAGMDPTIPKGEEDFDAQTTAAINVDVVSSTRVIDD